MRPKPPKPVCSVCGAEMPRNTRIGVDKRTPECQAEHLKRQRALWVEYQNRHKRKKWLEMHPRERLRMELAIAWAKAQILGAQSASTIGCHCAMQAI